MGMPLDMVRSDSGEGSLGNEVFDESIFKILIRAY